MSDSLRWSRWRRSLRAVALSLATLSLITCAQDPVGLGGGRARLKLTPVLPPYARVAPLAIDRVGIIVERLLPDEESSEVVFSDTVAFPVNKNRLTLDDISITMEAPSEDLQVTIQLLSATTLLFSGSQTVTVVRGRSTGNTVIPVFYQGPGSNLTTLVLAPRDTVVRPGASVDFRLDAFDVQGAPVPQYYVGWSLTGGAASSARLNAVGRLTASSVNDTFYVKVAAPNGVLDSTRVVVASSTTQPPATLTWTGAVSTDWSVAGNWSPAQVPSFLDSVIIGSSPAQRQPSLTEVVVTGSISIVAGGNLTIAGNAISIVRGLTTGGTGVLTMTDPSDVVVVQGDAVFDGGNELDLMSAGGLSIGGNLTQRASNSGDSFHPSGTHITLLAGATPTLSFATPGQVPGTSHFQDLAWIGTGTLTLATPVLAHGEMVVESQGASIIASSNGSRLTVGDLFAIGPLALNNVPLTLSTTTAGALTLTNLTFQNMPTTVSQLIVSHPGGSFTFSNLVFSTTPAAPNGFYLDVTDNTGPTDGGLTIDMVNPTPASGGAFVRTTGGAVVNWPSGTTAVRTWSGAQSTDWSVAANWVPAQVPDNTSDVTIPSGTPNAPLVTSSCSAHSLTVNVLATLNLGAFNCQVEGNVFANGTIAGTGSVQIAVPAQILGRFPGLILSGPATATGTLVVTGSLTLTGNAGDLVLGGHRANITGNLTTQGGAAFTMTSPLDTVDLLGNATFGGGSTTGKLTAGVLSVGRSFTQSGAATSFAASGSHRVNFTSNTTRTITFGDPVNSRFQHLDVGANLANFTLASNVTVLGQLISKPTGILPPVLTTAGAAGSVTLTAGGADITLLTLDKVPLVLSGGAIGGFTKVVFQNQLSTGTQLTVNNTGQATPFAFDQVTFLTLPTAGGLYLRANDLDGAAPNPLVINMTNASPASGGALFQVTNGAVVNWPAAVVRTWSGTTSTAWNVASNWVGGVVPSLIDSAVIPAVTNQPLLTANAAVGAVNVTGGTLALGGHTLAVSRTFATGGSGTLSMTNPLDTLAIAGNANFAGGSTSGLLTNGAITVGGNFTQQGASSSQSFAASSLHRTRLDAITPTVSFATPGLTASHFGVLEQGNAATGFAFATDVAMTGALEGPDGFGGTITGTNVALTVTRGVSGAIMNGVRLIIDDPAGQSGGVSGLTFVNLPTSASQMTIRHPGIGITQAYTVSSITWMPLAAGNTGAYIDATDVNGPTGGVLTISSLSNDPGNGPAFTRVAGGAQVFWPGTPLVWTGAVSGDWFSNGNWNSLRVPFTDNVTVPAGTPNAPLVAGFNANVNDLTVAAGQVLTVADAVGIAVLGNVNTPGQVATNGAGGLSLNGTGRTVAGSLGNTIVTGSYSLAGNATMTTVVVGPGTLTLGGRTLTTADFLSTTTSGLLVMSNPNDSLRVSGQAVFGGGNQTGLLTAGVIVVGGDLSVNVFAPTALVASGSHKVVLNGSGSRSVLVPPASSSRFQDLEIATTGAGSGVLLNSGAVVVNGNLLVSSGQLGLNNRKLTVGGNFSITGTTGSLSMAAGGDSLIVTGNATFSGASTAGSLTGGVLQVGGNLTQSAVVSTTSFAPSGTHKTVLGAAAARAISIGSPGPGATGSHFQVLDVSNAVGGLSLDVNLQADSLISTAAAAKLTSPGVALTVRRAQVSGLTLDNTRFILDEQLTFSTENFSNVTFTGFPTTGTIMLTVTGPGNSFAPRPVVLTSNITFQSLPTGAGNFYVDLTSTNSQQFTMTMTGSNQSINGGGNGPFLTRVTPGTGIATVSWP